MALKCDSLANLSPCQPCEEQVTFLIQLQSMLGSVKKKGRFFVPFDKLVAAVDGWTYLRQLVNIRRQLEERVTVDMVVITEKSVFNIRLKIIAI